MATELIPLWITVAVSLSGVAYAIFRNGRRSREQDENLKTELKLEMGIIKGKLEDPIDGLGAIRKATDNMKLHCMEVSTGISSEVAKNTKEIDILRSKKCKE